MSKYIFMVICLVTFILVPILYYVNIIDMEIQGILPLLVVQILAIGLYIVLLIPAISKPIKWIVYSAIIVIINLWAFSIVHYWYYIYDDEYKYFELGIWQYHLLTLISSIILGFILIQKMKPKYFLSISIVSASFITIHSLYRMFWWLGPPGDDGPYFFWGYCIVPMTLGIIILSSFQPIFKPGKKLKMKGTS